MMFSANCTPASTTAIMEAAIREADVFKIEAITARSELQELRIEHLTTTEENQDQLILIQKHEATILHKDQDIQLQHQQGLELQGLCNALQDMLEQRDRTIKERNRVLEEQLTKLKELEGKLDESTKVIVELSEVMGKQTDAIVKLNKVLGKQTEELRQQKEKIEELEEKDKPYWVIGRR